MDTCLPTLQLRDRIAPFASSAHVGSHDELDRMDAFWRAANYLSVGQIYLYNKWMLREPLKLAHVKPLVVGNCGTTPGQDFIYLHLNRVIKKFDLDMCYIAGSGHGGPAIAGDIDKHGEDWPEIRNWVWGQPS